jgi:hypothetical protein
LNEPHLLPNRANIEENNRAKIEKDGRRKALISITTFKGGNMCCKRRVRIARKARGPT